MHWNAQQVEPILNNPKEYPNDFLRFINVHQHHQKVSLKKSSRRIKKERRGEEWSPGENSKNRLS